MNTLLDVLGKTLVGAKENVASMAEDLFDLAVSNDTLEQVPIVEYAIKVLSIRDQWHKNRIKRNYLEFVRSVSELNSQEIERHAEALKLGGDLGLETAETIFEIILESEKPLKAKLIGNLSKSLARNELNLEYYNTLALLIQASSVAALRALPEFISANGNRCFKHSNGGIPQEGLLLSLGVATRFGSGFQVDVFGQALAIHGFGIEARFT
jgi:hypothetical protein